MWVAKSVDFCEAYMKFKPFCYILLQLFSCIAMAIWDSSIILIQIRMFKVRIVKLMRKYEIKKLLKFCLANSLR